MDKITIKVGPEDGKQKLATFTGEKLGSKRFLDDPPHDSRGAWETLYQVPGGKYRVVTVNWSHWQGEEDSNYTEVSEPLTRKELISRYGALSTACGILEEVDLDEVDLDEEEEN